MLVLSSRQRFGVRATLPAVMALLFLIISQFCLIVWAFCGRAVNQIFRTPASLVWFQRAVALCLLISAWAGLLL